MNKQPIEKRDLDPEGRLWVHSIFYTIQGEGPFAGVPAVFVRLQGCNLQCPGCDTIYTAPYGGRTELQKTHVKPTLLAEMVETALQMDGRMTTVPLTLVVITGGEPFRQNIIPFIMELRKRPGFFVQIETNGTFSPLRPEGVDIFDFYSVNYWTRRGVFIVCSPKTPNVHGDYNALACCFKYVLDHRSVDPDDGLPTNVLCNVAPHQLMKPRRVYRQKIPVRPIYLQPMDHSIELGQSEFTVSYERVQRDNYLSLEAAKASCLKHGYTFQLQVHKHIGVE